MKYNKTYTENLIVPIIDASEASTWEEAVLEWEICDCEEDESAQTSCMCGHEGIRYLFQIHNKINGNTFGPIGSECIKKFGRSDLSSKVDLQEQMFKLYHALDHGWRIELSPLFFSRKLLALLWGLDVITHSDCEFMLKMFNKRNKNDITTMQQRKINAIIAYSIKPFLAQRLAAKRRSAPAKAASSCA